MIFFSEIHPEVFLGIIYKISPVDIHEFILGTLSEIFQGILPYILHCILSGIPSEIASKLLHGF